MHSNCWSFAWANHWWFINFCCLFSVGGDLEFACSTHTPRHQHGYYKSRFYNEIGSKKMAYRSTLIFDVINFHFIRFSCWGRKPSRYCAVHIWMAINLHPFLLFPYSVNFFSICDWSAGHFVRWILCISVILLICYQEKQPILRNIWCSCNLRTTCTIVISSRVFFFIPRPFHGFLPNSRYMRALVFIRVALVIALLHL